ncbi:hypothetical protein COW36_06655 [bacterium (Candidatus Blackallbacteria) CG17_big_fil_post_rev_8_21_14_2_50_48_46]|uniref:Uncharacterized protein n=1 Tax=bacterium (Candidatus Blackallbacteria) CG17_big_fil_post_rev_8_21_14_2_50_48_46 TaxID=2014261 RepID=A0A2M7G7G3_9BACT|nr:MAG: hypothetical protein COW64_15235 [bacterium (Candidatus Blackallbacteria) CG18_big_fil_WC_8_21_14_2_50_49_26]PIW18018.1 MAG: hypothetical protein COW36_06655 [bacterium (Candidatus Blackallbacteria) CG17_big_fil_post_rev_8_21_14_2_50_48_46]PIW50937.1 MAG: hypothetical protein COW20_00850 [bacterium (Candidatus Blackallbacteria) CG13_big_fil_rev_8_21_14_2_50_49_14]
MSNTLEIESTPLSKLETILNHIGLPAYREEKSEEIPFEYVLVALDEEIEKEPEYFLKLVFMEDILNTPGAQGETIEHPEHLNRFATLQIYLEIPLQIPQQRLLDTYRLVSALSSLIPNGSLVINEAEENTVVYFSHTHLMRPETLDIGLVVEIIDQTKFFLNRFLPQIQSFSQGAMSLSEILEETQKKLVSATQA